MKKLTVLILALFTLPMFSWAQSNPLVKLVAEFPEHTTAFEKLDQICSKTSGRTVLEILATPYMTPEGFDADAFNADSAVQKVLSIAEFMGGACAGNLITSANPICPGDFTTLTGTQTLGVTPVNFLWWNNSTAPNQTISFSTQTDIWVQGTGGDGCSWFADATIWMSQNNITATISGNPNFCSGSFATLTASGGSQVIWSGPNGYTSTNWTITVNQPGLYTATVSNGGGCNGSASVNVSMSQAPNISISGPAGFCPNTAVTLTASSNVPNTTYTWSNGQSGPSMTTTTGGTFTVTANVPGGCSSSLSKTVIAFPAPSAIIKVVRANDVTTVSVSTPIALWSNGATTPTINNAPNGIYAVTVTDGNNCVAMNPGVEVDMSACAPPCPLPIAGFTFSVNGPLVTFTNTSQNATSYMWSFGDNTTSMSASPTHAYQPGTWTVTLTATNVCNGVTNTSIFTQTITIQCPPPTAAFTFATNGATATFTNSSTGNGLTYLWNFGNGATSTAQNPTYTYATSGSYTVTLKVTNNCGATHQVSKIVTVFFCGPLDAQFNLPQSGGLNLQFTNTSVGTGLSYFWTFGDGGTSTDEDPSHSYAQAGVYLVKLKVFDACGNQDQIVKTLTVLNAVEPVGDRQQEFTAFPNPFRSSGTVTFNGLSTGVKFVQILDATGRVEATEKMIVNEQ
ncbi:MAG: PKD domain-containing protein [Candidatus Pacebacteria bacterium]|nr:PKD domain-containing protein [Candidatus Paceibacterota bacterium]MBP9851405.1 PKD domain-containing protein [Candidatus Paceibacterota bacterium]